MNSLWVSSQSTHSASPTKDGLFARVRFIAVEIVALDAKPDIVVVAVAIDDEIERMTKVGAIFIVSLFRGFIKEIGWDLFKEGLK